MFLSYGQDRVQMVQDVQEVQEVQKVQGVQMVQGFQMVQEVQDVQKVQWVQLRPIRILLARMMKRHTGSTFSAQLDFYISIHFF